MICNIKKINDIMQTVKINSLPSYIIIDIDAANKSRNLLSKYKKIFVICDDNTQAIAQKFHFSSKIFSLGSNVKPTIKNVQFVSNFVKEADLLLAVGSGTINDICKYAALLSKIDYFIYATAPSMNGYCSATSSLIDDNNCKKSYQTSVPTAVIMDLKIIATAPMRLIKSGIGDLLCRCSVYTDWLIGSKLFNVGNFNYKFHNISKEYENELLVKIDNILKRDLCDLQKMCEIIILQGIMMCLEGSSNSASQSEHMIAHLYNQFSCYNIYHTHGEEVALATVIMLKLQEKILTRENFDLAIPKASNYNNLPYLNKKLNHYVDLIKSNKLNYEKWFKIKKYIIKNISCDNEQVLNAINKAGLPTQIADLNWNKARIIKAINEAAFYRERYTLLDLAILTGDLKTFLELSVL